MNLYRKKPIPVAAHQWFKNGDHPEDGFFSQVADEAGRAAWEGLVVRRFNRPDVDGGSACKHCGKFMHIHGWIETLEGGHIVCPGDWVITGVKGERYPVKDEIFKATYERVEAISTPRVIQPSAKFKPGDRIRVIKNHWESGIPTVGMCGVVVEREPVEGQIWYRLKLDDRSGGSLPESCIEPEQTSGHFVFSLGGPSQVPAPFLVISRTGALQYFEEDESKWPAEYRPLMLLFQALRAEACPSPRLEDTLKPLLEVCGEAWSDWREESYLDMVKLLTEQLRGVGPLVSVLHKLRQNYPGTHNINQLDGDATRALWAEADKVLESAVYAKTPSWSKLDVRTIMLDIEPGPDGEGVEIYAKSVEEVEQKLAALSESLGNVTIERNDLRTEVEANAVRISRRDTYIKELEHEAEESIEDPEPKPIPLYLTCPKCSQQHIDEGEWATRVHHTHSCQHCGLTWRPAVAPTVGVQFLPGFKNGDKS